MPMLVKAKFHTTVVQITGLERSNLPEVAFAGRSNAGKSSAINALCQRKKLAFSSRTPGRTQALNFFSINDKQDNPEAFLVDMPGYGYAEAPLALKKSWDTLAGRYLQVRGNLAGLVLIVDIRRGLGDLDRALLAWLQPNVPVCVVLSKADKLNQTDRSKAAKALRDELATMPDQNQRDARVVVFSVLAKLGIDEVKAVVEYWFNPIGQAPEVPTKKVLEKKPLQQAT